nr:hypothetical protein [Pedobacter sp. ASV19]
MKSNLQLHNRILFYLLPLWFVITCSNGKNSNTRQDATLSQKKALEEIDLINQYFSKEVKKDSIVLLSQPYNLQATDCLEEVIKDLPKSKFTLEDFNSHAAKDTLEWSAHAHLSVKLLPVGKLPGRNDPAKWNDLFRSIDGGYFQLSHVLFTKDLKSAIMHVEFSCGDRCGQEMTLLFQKSGKQWILKKRYCLKVS